MILNVVHPYTYKQIKDTLYFGPVEQFRERDSKISKLIASALDGGHKVYLHYLATNPINNLIIESALQDDLLYEVLFDDGIGRIPTSEKGIPLSLENVRLGEDLVFIGGLVERCLGNSIKVFRFLSKPEFKIYYVPELCVSESKRELKKVKKELDKLGIVEISYDSVLKRLYDEQYLKVDE